MGVFLISNFYLITYFEGKLTIMKKPFFAFLSLSLFLCVISIELFAQRNEKIKLYGVSYNSIDILGVRGGFGPDVPNYTELLTDPTGSSSRYELLGKGYHKNEMSKPFDLMKSSYEFSPILDSIDISFYENEGISDIIRDTKISKPIKDSAGALRKKLRKLSSLKEKKDFLNDLEGENLDLLLALEQSRYTFKDDRIIKKLHDSLVRKLNLTLAADIRLQLKNEGDTAKNKLAISIANKFIDSVARVVKMDSGFYVDVYLKDRYIQRASEVFSYYNTNRNLFTKFNDNFTKQFIKYLDDPCAAIITSAAVFELEIASEKFSQLTTSLGGTLEAKLDLSKEKANSLAAKLTAQWYSSRAKSLSVISPRGCLTVRYGYSEGLEVGAKGCRP